MLKEYKRKTRIGIFLWLSAQIIGTFFAFNLEVPSFIVLILLYGSTLPFIYGLSCWAIGKGYHGAWGFLGMSSLYNPPLGPFSMVALLIFAVFPDRHKSQEKKFWQRFIKSKEKKGV